MVRKRPMRPDLERAAEEAFSLIEKSEKTFGGYTAREVAGYLRQRHRAANKSLQVGFCEYQNGNFEVFIRDGQKGTHWELEGEINDPRFIGLRDVLECAIILSAAGLSPFSE